MNYATETRARRAARRAPPWTRRSPPSRPPATPPRCRSRRPSGRRPPPRACGPEDVRGPALRQRLVVSARAHRCRCWRWRWSRRCSSTAGSGCRSTLAAPVVVWGAWPFHRAAWINARHGAATMDTLISLGVLAAYALVAVRAVPRRRRDAGHADALRAASPEPGRGADGDLPRGRRGGHRVHPRRPLPRGPGRDALRRGAAGAARAGRQGRRRAARTAASSASRSASSPSATSSWSGPARRSPPTAWSIEGRRRSTPRMLTGEPVPVEVGPGDAGGRRDGERRRPAGRAGHPRRRRHPAGPDRPAGRARPRPARRRCSGWPTGSPRCSCRS